MVLELASHIRRTVGTTVRGLLRTPTFTAGAILILALTVGATTALFSLVYAVLLRSLPYRQVDRVFWIWMDRPGGQSPFNVPDFLDYRASARTLTGIGGFYAYTANFSDPDGADRLQGIRATGNFFVVLGARAQIGRLLEPEDEDGGGARVVVLSHAVWVQRFGTDKTLVGRPIQVNGEAYTVVGILPATFALPIRDVDFVLPYSPAADSRRNERGSLNFIQMVGRLGDDTSLAAATSELNGIARRLQAEFPVANATKRGVRTTALLDGIVGPFRIALNTLFAAIGGVLLIACANLANLMLTRAAARRKESAVRLAIGAMRAHLIRHVLLEAGLLSAAGCLLSVPIAQWSAAGLAALAPTALPRSNEIQLSAAVFAFTLGVSSVTCLLFGVAPAVASARVDVREALLNGSRGATESSRARGVLVAAEVAIAAALLVVMTMLAKSFAVVEGASPGFEAAGVLSLRVTLPTARYTSRDAITAFAKDVTQRFSVLPGITQVAAISILPLSGRSSRVPFTVEGRSIDRASVPMAQCRFVSAGYFEAAGIPSRHGRTFSGDDTALSRPVAVVSEELAAKWLPGVNPIGARLLIDDNNAGPRPVEIVGVVGNVSQIAIDVPPTFDLYLPYAQLHPDQAAAAAENMFWLLHTRGDPMVLATSAARALHEVDPMVAASEVQPMGRYLAEALGPRRFSVLLMVAFAVTALVLAVAGIYAVVLYGASRQAREIGIRVALGAGRWDVTRLVMGHGVRSVLVGVATGLVLATVTVRWLSTLLVGLTASDAATYAEVGATVAIVTLAACALPVVRIRRLASGRWNAE